MSSGGSSLSTLDQKSSAGLSMVLYNLVKPMIASSHCVKCVADEGTTIFTNNVEHFLSSLDIVHPAGEIIISALKAHHREHGTGVRTLLFFLTRIVKAVSQLQELGIPESKSLATMKDAMAKLLKMVDEISIPVVTGVTHVTEPSLPVSDKSINDLGDESNKNTHNVRQEKILMENQIKLMNTYSNIETSPKIPSAVCEALPNCDNDQGCSESIIHKRKPNVEMNFSVKKSDNLYSVYILGDPCKSVVYIPQENVDTENPFGLMDDDIGSINQKYGWEQSAHLSGKGHKCLESESFVPTAGKDIIYLTKACHVEDSEDHSDVEWLFDEKTQGDTAVINGSVLSLKTLMSEKGIQDKEHCDRMGVDRRTTSKTLPSLGDGDQHDSDFEDCFDDVDVRQHVSVVVEQIPPVGTPVRGSANFDIPTKKDEILHTNARKHFPLSEDFEDVGSISSLRKEDSDENDDFNDCFSELCVPTAENKGINYPHITKYSKHVLRYEKKHDAFSFLSNRSEVNSNRSNAKGYSNDEIRDCKLQQHMEIKSAIERVDDCLASLGAEKYVTEMGTHCTDMDSTSLLLDPTRFEEHVEESKEVSEKHITACDSSYMTPQPNGVNLTKNLAEINGVTDEEKNKILDKVIEQKILSLKSSSRSKVFVSSRHLSASDCEINLCCKDEKADNSQLSTGTTSDMIPTMVSSEPDESTFDLDLSHDRLNSYNDELNRFAHETGRKSDFYLLADHNVNQDECRIVQERPMTDSSFSDPLSYNVEPEACVEGRSNHQNFSALHLLSESHLLNKDPLAEVAAHVYLHQVQHQKETGYENSNFSLHLVDCLTVSSRSLSSTCLVQGVVIACDRDNLEDLRSKAGLRKAMLVNGDLTPTHRHKGYKPLFSKRTYVAGGSDLCESDLSEAVWAKHVVDAFTELNVDTLLVHGKVNSCLRTSCLGSGILLFSDVPYHTLSIVSHLHGVDMLTSVTDATLGNVCCLHVKPLNNWKDKMRENETPLGHHVVISNMKDVQTIIISSLCEMSAQLIKEMMWKCLHNIHNAVKDGVVLPGQGMTEAWCADQVLGMAHQALLSQYPLQSRVLEELASVFQDFSATVKINLQNQKDHSYHDKCVEHGDFLFKCEDSTILTGQDYSYVTSRYSLPVEVPEECLQESSVYLSPFHTEADRYSHFTLPVTKLNEVNNRNKKDNGKRHIPNGQSEAINCVHVDSGNQQLLRNQQHVKFDNFATKLAAWESSLDLAHILLSLHSLVVTGVDTTQGGFQEFML